MTHIIKGSQVCVTFTLIAFSNSDVSQMQSYDGVPCLLDIISGTGMILNALDEAISQMNVDERREIIVPAVDAAQTARALGVHILGLLKYELKILRVVNTPVDSKEITAFLKKRRVSLEALSETKSVKKGPFNIVRTYCMFEANGISEEYRILESLYKRRNDERCSSHSSHSSSSFSSFSSSIENNMGTDSNYSGIKNTDSNFTDSVYTDSSSLGSRIHDGTVGTTGGSSPITVNTINCYSGGGDDYDDRNKGNRKNGNSDNVDSSNDNDNDNNADNKNGNNDNKNDSINTSIYRSKFLLPSWTLDQPKELFLPELLRLAVTHRTRIVILFDAPDDWAEVTKQLEILKKRNGRDSGDNVDTDNRHITRRYVRV